MDLRKIDALVAELIMGVDWTGGRGGPSPYMPRYSTEIGDAWTILKTFPAWSMKYDPEDGIVTVCLEYEGNRIYDQSNYAPLAICLAALKAKGVEVPK